MFLVRITHLRGFGHFFISFPSCILTKPFFQFFTSRNNSTFDGKEIKNLRGFRWKIINRMRDAWVMRAQIPKCAFLVSTWTNGQPFHHMQTPSRRVSALYPTNRISNWISWQMTYETYVFEAWRCVRRQWCIILCTNFHENASKITHLKLHEKNAPIGRYATHIARYIIKIHTRKSWCEGLSRRVMRAMTIFVRTRFWLKNHWFWTTRAACAHTVLRVAYRWKEHGVTHTWVVANAIRTSWVVGKIQLNTFCNSKIHHILVHRRRHRRPQDVIIISL